MVRTPPSANTTQTSANTVSCYVHASARGAIARTSFRRMCCIPALMNAKPELVSRKSFFPPAFRFCLAKSKRPREGTADAWSVARGGVRGLADRRVCGCCAAGTRKWGYYLLGAHTRRTCNTLLLSSIYFEGSALRGNEYECVKGGANRAVSSPARRPTGGEQVTLRITTLSPDCIMKNTYSKNGTGAARRQQRPHSHACKLISHASVRRHS